MLTLSLGALQREAKTNEDGLITIFIGVALRYQALEEMLPFRAVLNSSKKMRKASKEEAKTNLKKLQKLKAGFDHVVPMNDDGAPAESRRIYWLPDAVLKLAVLHLQLEERKPCQICMEETPATEGWLCDSDGGERHFTCDECFAGHVSSKVDGDLCELRLRMAAKGKVYCPLRRTDRGGNVIGCAGSSPISEADIVLHARASFDAFLKNKNELLEITLRASITEEQKKLFKAEQARLARMSDQERVINVHRTHIVEEILTLKCPRCRAAFLDFEGCFALSCSGCNCGICGWCLADCGDDAHAHVATCPSKPAGGQQYHGSLQQFEQVHKPRREREAREYLQRIADGEVRRKTVTLSRKDFEDLGMRALVQEFGAAAPQQADADGGSGLDEQLALALQADENDAEDEEPEVAGGYP
jgi:hypothetical protein